jgi:hypothetical protein
MVPYRLLQGFDLFDGLNEDELKAIAALGHEENFDEGEVIFQEGAEARRVYLLLEGRVTLRFRLPLKPPSRETTIDTMGKVSGFREGRSPTVVSGEQRNRLCGDGASYRSDCQPPSGCPPATHP